MSPSDSRIFARFLLSASACISIADLIPGGASISTVQNKTKVHKFRQSKNKRQLQATQFTRGFKMDIVYKMIKYTKLQETINKNNFISLNKMSRNQPLL